MVVVVSTLLLLLAGVCLLAVFYRPRLFRHRPLAACAANSRGLTATALVGRFRYSMG